MHFRLLLLVCAFSLFSSNLLYVNEQSLNQLLESNEYLLVNLMFGMDDYESVSLQMELEKVRASISNYTLPKIQFAETDIKIEKNLTKKLKVQSKSGLILFKGKEELFIMEGARSESDILIWLKRMTNQLLFVEVNTDEEINKILEEKEAVILYIGSYSSDRFTIFNESAYLTRLEYQYGFAYTQNPVLLDKYETQKGIERVIVFTHYEPPKYYPGLFDAKEIRSFIFEASLSPFNELDDRVAQRIFGEEFPSMVLFGEQKEIDVFLHAVKVTKIYEKMLVTYTTGKSGLSQRIMDLIGLKKEDMPCVWILVVNNEDILRYQMKGEIKEENIVYFFTQWIEGRLRGFLSSEDEWRAADKGPIKTIIGKTFERTILHNKQNVLLMTEASACNECLLVRSILEKLAEKYKQNESLLFASINVSFNKIEQMINSFPSILFFGIEDKLNPVIYSGELTQEKVEDFLMNNLKSGVQQIKKTEL